LLTRLRLVLDTHVWLDWLVFDDPGIVRIRNAVGLKRAEIFIDAACEAELARVLAYDLHKRKLDAAAQAACIAQCRACLTASTPRCPSRSAPDCRAAATPTTRSSWRPRSPRTPTCSSRRTGRSCTSPGAARARCRSAS